MELVHQSAQVFRKDLLLQWRSRSRFVAVASFGVTVLLLFSFAVGPDTTVLRQHAAGYLWLALLLSSTLALSESFRLEAQNGALDALRLLPTDPRAIFYGKALANLVALLILGVVLVPLVVVLYGARVELGFGRLFGLIALGSAGLSAPGTLYAALAARARGSDVLLPLLLFPLIIPALLSVVKATGLVLEGDPMDQMGGWVGLCATFDLIYWSLCGLLFREILED